jgi:hypothetical protein
MIDNTNINTATITHDISAINSQSVPMIYIGGSDISAGSGMFFLRDLKVLNKVVTQDEARVLHLYDDYDNSERMTLL